MHVGLYCQEICFDAIVTILVHCAQSGQLILHKNWIIMVGHCEPRTMMQSHT